MSDGARDAVAAVEPAVYDAAIRAVEEVADGVPAWVVVVAVNAAMDEAAR